MGWQRFDTECGAPLWFLSMPHVRNCSIGVMVRCGSRDEQWPGQACFAHSLEHYLCQGSTCTLSSFFELVRHIEDVGGDFNAITGQEQMLFCHKISSREIRRSIRVLGESLVFPRFPEEVMPAQHKILLQELYEQNDDPQRALSDIWLRARLGDHPLSHTDMGMERAIKRFTREDLIGFWQKFFHPANFVFIVVGRADPGELCDLFNLHFSLGEERAANQREPVSPPPPPAEPLMIVPRQVSNAHVLSGALLGPGNARATRALKLFSCMVGGGMSFPLFQRVREEMGYCYTIFPFVVQNGDVSYFFITFDSKPRRFEAALDLSFKTLHQNKNNRNLLERAKRAIRGGLDLIDDTGRILDQAVREVATHGAPRLYKRTAALYEAVTIEEVEGAVNQYLCPEQFFTAAMLSK